ncbi:MAG TPA: M50 family metallopeptidase [Candidatus Limnocylindrales bacterium]|nr:M50 family metallopeptidase [Candidatus Limnocylindrales bacterium]
MLTGLIFLLILSVLVLIHEAGHFFVAKKLGIKVEEFGFGLPLTKALFSVKRGETTYSFYPALIGGFVKLYGEDEAGAGRIKVKEHKEVSKDKDRAFFSRPIWQRVAVIVAGVVMNTVLAVAIYYSFLGITNFRTEIPLLGDHKFFAVNQQNKSEIIISDVAKDSPAEKAKVKPLSKILSVNGQKVATMDFFIEFIKKNKGQEVILELQDLKTSDKQTIKLTPRVNPPKNQGALGVSFFPIKTAVLTYETQAQKLFSGFTHPLNLMSYNFDVMGKLIATSIKDKTAEPISQGVSGPVGIYSVVGEIINIPNMRERVLQLLNLAGLLSISLAFFNVLPIPGLDGGRLFFIIIEAVTRKKLNPKFEAYANAIGMAVLIGLIILVTFKDLFQILK